MLLREIPKSKKFEIIRILINKYDKKYLLHISKFAGVSKSGYYKYFSRKATINRISKEEKDEIDYEIIYNAFKFRNRKKGARQIKMILNLHFNLNFNLKKLDD